MASSPAPLWQPCLDISSLAALYRNGTSPVQIAETVLERIRVYHDRDPAVWIYRVPEASVLSAARILPTHFPNKDSLPPLYGVPFSLKDNIDVAGIPTTTACPPFTRSPHESSTVFEELVRQGALFIGKTNMDQLASGLTGCRSPYGIPRSVYSEEYITGGSSSGSAVSVGADLVSFSIGTDTAGSVRVPAAFNGVVGLKPTKGLISASGVTPACASLDCVGILARNLDDAIRVWHSCMETLHDEKDVHSKQGFRGSAHPSRPAEDFLFVIPPSSLLEACSPAYRQMFDLAVDILQAIGGKQSLSPSISINWDDIQEAGRLLYGGAFLSERIADLPDGFLETQLEHFHPVTRQVFEEALARNDTAIQAFRDLHAQATLIRNVGPFFKWHGDAEDEIAIIVTPTTPSHFTISDVLADPIRMGSILGTYTQFANVLDLPAVSVPAGTYNILEGSGNHQSRPLPFSITLTAGCCNDAGLLNLAKRFEDAISLRDGGPGQSRRRDLDRC
ncbi:MAG: hypothetical protein M1819_001933 [Sarea resinae]|nr:MAG: hypothetical protein M1819_001933 [Sarea resinae]